MKFNYCQLNRMQHGVRAVSIIASLKKTTEINDLLNSETTLADAVYGYALIGQTKQIDEILKNHPTLEPYAAMGYARAGHEDETEKLAKSYEITKALVKGYAQAANQTQINAALRSKNSREYLLTIVEGLAELGHTELVKQYAITTELQNSAITAAAHSGNVTLVNELLALQNIVLAELTTPIKPGAILPLGHALIGYSRGRHYKQVEPLLNLNINPMLCLTAITDENSSIHESDIQSLSEQIKNTPLRHSLLKLIKEHFGISAEQLETKDFSNDSELEQLFNNFPLTPTEHLATISTL